MTTITHRAFGGVIPDHKRIPDDALGADHLRWERAHQKRELAAYLKGHKVFTHGRDAMRNPLRFNVREILTTTTK